MILFLDKAKKKLSMKLFITSVIIIFYNQIIFGQLEFTNEKRLLFFGSEMIENKNIISSVYISPIDSTNLKLQIDVLDNWDRKESINISVKFDESSLNNLFFINDTDIRKAAYRYFNNNGIEIFIAKEEWHDNSYNQNNEKIEKFYTLSIVEIILPKNKKYYVNRLPIMFQK